MKCNNLSCEHLNQFGYCEMMGCTRKKMRLVDSGEIIRIVREEVKDEDNTLPVSFRAGVDYVLKIITDEIAPTVEAIPVEQLLSILPKYDDYIHTKTYPYNETTEDIYSKGHKDGWDACLKAIKEELNYKEKENE